MRLYLLLAILLSGCAATLGVSEVAPSVNNSENVLKLTDYPANRSHRSLTTIDIKVFRAGLSQPTADDVWEEVSKAVSSKGGNACLMRGQKVDDIFQRRITVTCEVLAVSEIRS